MPGIAYTSFHKILATALQSHGIILILLRLRDVKVLAQSPVALKAGGLDSIPVLAHCEAHEALLKD